MEKYLTYEFMGEISILPYSKEEEKDLKSKFYEVWETTEKELLELNINEVEVEDPKGNSIKLLENVSINKLIKLGLVDKGYFGIKEIEDFLNNPIITKEIE